MADEKPEVDPESEKRRQARLKEAEELRAQLRAESEEKVKFVKDVMKFEGGQNNYPIPKINPNLLDPTKDPTTYTKEELERIAADPAVQETFTPEKVLKFAQGRITFAELIGLTAEEAYAMADLAWDFMEQGKYDDAKAISEGLVIANPYDSTFHNLLGCIYARKEMWEEAVEEYTLTIELDPDQIGPRVNRAEIMLQHGELEQAMDDLSTAVRMDPEGKDEYGVRARSLAAATAAILEEILAHREGGMDKEADQKRAAAAKASGNKPSKG